MGTNGREIRMGEGLSFNLPQHSPHITSVQYCEGCSVHWRLFSISDRGITSVLSG